jgi:hypothetical protein
LLQKCSTSSTVYRRGAWLLQVKQQHIQASCFLVWYSNPKLQYTSLGMGMQPLYPRELGSLGCDS